MNIADWIVIGLIAVGAVFALISIFRGKKGCCGNCSGCDRKCGRK